MPSRLRLLLWGAVLALALGLRLPALSAGLPYMGYADEGFVLHPAVRVLRTGHWDPGAYAYPSLPVYAIAGAVFLYSPVYSALHGHSLGQDLSESPPRSFGILGPAEVVVAGRLLTLAASLGIVALTGLLARCLGGDAAGLLAALLAAVVPALVIRSAIVCVDPWATFFALAALFFAGRAGETGRPYRSAILAGVLTGCAATSKYTGILVGIAVAVLLLGMGEDWRVRLRAVELAVVAFLAAAVATMPALVLKSGEVLETLAGHAAGYTATLTPSYWDQAVRRAEWDLPFTGPELGVPFLVCAVLGWIVAARDPRCSRTLVAWTLWAGILLVLFASYSAQPFRNLLPLVPIACILVALLFTHAGGRLPARWRPWAGAAAVLLALALYLPSLSVYARERLRMVDSRVEAVDWLLRHRRPEETLLVSAELNVLPPELARLPGKILVLRQPKAISHLSRRRDVRFVVTGNFRQKDHNLRETLHRGGTRALYRRAAAFGGAPGLGRSDNRRRVLIYQQIPAGTPPARIFPGTAGIPAGRRIDFQEKP